MTLIANKITKKIHGRTVLRDVSLKLESGTVYGFIGRNGSGKTMLFRALSGLITLTDGTVIWNNRQLHRDMSVLPELGIILENVGLYPNKTGIENLAYLAKFRRKIGREEIREALIRVGLDPDDQRSYRKYSLGMKQRLAIAQAIMEHPDVIMLDEPTNGLDTDGVELIRTLILEEKQRGALVLLASHNSEDIRLLADRIFRIEEGKVMEGEDKNETA